MGGIETSLNKILTLWLGDKGLELGGSECVNEAGLGDDEEQDLCASKSRKFVGLFHNASFPFGERYMTSRFILDEFDLDLSSSSLLI